MKEIIKTILIEKEIEVTGGTENFSCPTLKSIVKAYLTEDLEIILEGVLYNGSTGFQTLKIQKEYLDEQIKTLETLRNNNQAEFITESCKKMKNLLNDIELKLKG